MPSGIGYGIMRGISSRTDRRGAVDKVRENRVRRAVARRGYHLEKRRRRDVRAWDYDSYQIRDPHTDAIVFADWSTDQGYGLSIDDVEGWLAGDTPKPG